MPLNFMRNCNLKLGDLVVLDEDVFGRGASEAFNDNGEVPYGHQVTADDTLCEVVDILSGNQTFRLHSIVRKYTFTCVSKFIKCKYE
jgi:hypothetical protein